MVFTPKTKEALLRLLNLVRAVMSFASFLLCRIKRSCMWISASYIRAKACKREVTSL